MFGQTFVYSAFSRNHFSSPGSVSGLIASTGHSGTQTLQSALVRVDDEHVLAFIEAVHRTHFDAIHNLATDAVVVDDIGQLASLRHIALWDALAKYLHGRGLRRPGYFKT
jgi:L-rhamnose isomerase